MKNEANKKVDNAAEPAKAAEDAVAEQPMAQEPPGGWPADEFTGVGGSYVRDPVTGVRRPA